ncbi:MAG: hypothetical protein V1732_05810 [Patescibacteria group bacterium]
MDGIINPKESPKIKIGLHGQLSKPQEFDAIVDTGFTGTISMPFAKALPLGLILFGTASFTLADGSKENTFLCVGFANIEGKQKSVVISLSKGNDILVGTEFLSTFSIKLELNYLTNTFALSAGK